MTHIPLAYYDTSFPTLNAVPHMTPFDEVLSPGICSTQSSVFPFTPVRNETPFHCMHYHVLRGRVGFLNTVCVIFRTRTSSANDWTLCSWSNVITRNKFFLIYPLSNILVRINLVDQVSYISTLWLNFNKRYLHLQKMPYN